MINRAISLFSFLCCLKKEPEEEIKNYYTSVIKRQIFTIEREIQQNNQIIKEITPNRFEKADKIKIPTFNFDAARIKQKNENLKSSKNRLSSFLRGDKKQLLNEDVNNILRINAFVNAIQGLEVPKQRDIVRDSVKAVLTRNFLNISLSYFNEAYKNIAHKNEAEYIFEVEKDNLKILKELFYVNLGEYLDYMDMSKSIYNCLDLYKNWLTWDRKSYNFFAQNFCIFTPVDEFLVINMEIINIQQIAQFSKIKLKCNFVVNKSVLLITLRMNGETNDLKNILYKKYSLNGLKCKVIGGVCSRTKINKKKEKSIIENIAVTIKNDNIYMIEGEKKPTKFKNGNYTNIILLMSLNNIEFY